MKPFRPKGSIFAAVDAGSSKVACLIARIIDDQGGIEVIGAGHHASNGIKNGRITDLSLAEHCIRQTVHTAENQAATILKSYPLREVLVGLSGIHTSVYHASVEVQTGGHEIMYQDLMRARAKAQSKGQQDEYDLIHTIPAAYAIDGHVGIEAPIGMVGKTLGLDVTLVAVEQLAKQNIATAIGRSHLDIAAYCLNSYAAGLSTLVEDEKELGCIVIDIGGGTTSFAVFRGGAMIYAESLPVGGRHITSDIARGLTTSLNNAERLKVLYGSAMITSSDDHEMLDVQPLGEDDPSQPNLVPRSLLVGIIQPRLEEIFEMVRARLTDLGLSDIGRRVVLTGGGCQISGTRELAQTVLDKQIRLGRPLGVSGLPEPLQGPAFAASTGLLSYISNHVDQIPAVVSMAEPVGVWQNIKRWVGENW